MSVLANLEHKIKNAATAAQKKFLDEPLPNNSIRNSILQNIPKLLTFLGRTRTRAR